MDLLGLEGSADGLARTSEERWYGDFLRKDGDDVLKRVMNFETVGGRGRGRPEMTWRRQVEKHIEQIELKKKDAIDRTK